MHQLREAAGWTQRRVAEALSVDPSLISRAESGQRPASRRLIDFYESQFDAEGLLRSFADAAAEFEELRRRRRDPELIARQRRYPLPGDESEFLGESPPDGTSVALGQVFTKSWTIRNSGRVPWRGRRLRRIGSTTGPWLLHTPRFVPIPDTDPGEIVTMSVPVTAPHVQAFTMARFKMVDEDELLYFPSRYSVGLALQVVVGY
jgi:transcriptional regulator with XRE-family HTH domain